LLKTDAAALAPAHIIGRRMVREDFERLTAVNDNRPDISSSSLDHRQRVCDVGDEIVRVLDADRQADRGFEHADPGADLDRHA
jgi:hypothetical protein